MKSLFFLSMFIFFFSTSTVFAITGSIPTDQVIPNIKAENTLANNRAFVKEIKSHFILKANQISELITKLQPKPFGRRGWMKDAFRNGMILGGISLIIVGILFLAVPSISPSALGIAAVLIFLYILWCFINFISI